jgi:hypothetical protein
MTVKLNFVPQLRPNLGRQMVHDSRSKAFSAGAVLTKEKWVTKINRIYDPSVNPNQCHGECTGCAKAMQMNAAGNRVNGVIFKMDDAHKFYHVATTLDPFEDVWPPDDTGSSGLASAKAAQKLGIGGAYQHVFNGADGVVQLIQEGKVVSVGTWWYEGLFNPDSNHIVEPTGPQVGGHQFVARGYNVTKDLVIIRCWWGDYRDVYIKREHLNELILDGGDAHVQERVRPS